MLSCVVLFVFNAKYDNFTEMCLITLSHPREVVANWKHIAHGEARVLFLCCEVLNWLWLRKTAGFKSNICCTSVSSYSCSSSRQFLQDSNKRLAGNLDSSSRLTNKKI